MDRQAFAVAGKGKRYRVILCIEGSVFALGQGNYLFGQFAFMGCQRFKGAEGLGPIVILAVAVIVVFAGKRPVKILLCAVKLQGKMVW